MKILLVEDQPDKAEFVRARLTEELSGLTYHITPVDNITAAKQAVRDKPFDLLIVDLAVPRRKDEAPLRDGGIQFLREIVGRPAFNQPLHVVGLTGYQDVFSEAGATFGSELWSLLLFERNSDAWVSPLANAIRRIAAATVDRSAAKFETDVCVCVAVQDELVALLKNGWAWERIEAPGDSTPYHRAHYRRATGGEGVAIAARSTNMGMPAATALATKMAMTFKPRVLAMTGICAGDSRQARLGDLIVGNPVWDYGSGKHSIQGNAARFAPAPYQQTLTTRVRGAVERLLLDDGFMQVAWAEFDDSKPDNSGVARIGPLATGAAVVADSAIFEEVQAQQHRKLLGIDMEAYGVMCAADDMPNPQPEAIVLKGVSDYADAAKGDTARLFAAYLSARALRELCEKHQL